jgi:hypothetical protein
VTGITVNVFSLFNLPAVPSEVLVYEVVDYCAYRIMWSYTKRCLVIIDSADSEIEVVFFGDFDSYAVGRYDKGCTGDVGCVGDHT